METSDLKPKSELKSIPGYDPNNSRTNRQTMRNTRSDYYLLVNMSSMQVSAFLSVTQLVCRLRTLPPELRLPTL